ncbi:MAG: M56 family metallopeptidase [Candidatus Zixiibacteriota bacterium]|nr:MAG: M56 family metallopeptidase [candidate division Zixibacteria bacterium]
METIFDQFTGISHESIRLAINGLWIGIILTAVMILAWRYLKPTGATTAFAAWWTLLVIVVALPFLAASRSTSISDSVEPTVSSEGMLADHGTPNEPGINTESEPVSTLANRSELQTSRTDEHFAALIRTGDEMRSEHKSEDKALAGQQQVSSNTEVWLGLVPVALFLGWGLVAAVLLCRLAVSYRSVLRMKRESRVLRRDEFPSIQELINRVPSGRSVQLRVSQRVELPMAAGLGKSMILIPETLIDHLSEAELEPVVLHELAHLNRHDDWSRLVQKFIEAVFFFHPAVHWIGRQLDLEREIACDDAVVAATGRPDDYAHCLTRLAQLTMGTGTLLIPGVLSGKKQLFKRFGRLLDTRYRARSGFSGIRFAAAAAAIVISSLTVLQVAPSLALPIEAVTYAELSEQFSALGNARVEAETEERVATSRAPLSVSAGPQGHGLIVELAESPTPPGSRAVPVIQSTPVALAEPGETSAESELPILAAAGLGDELRSGSMVSGWIGDEYLDGFKGISRWTDEDGQMTVSWSDGRRTLKARLEGSVVFAEDDRGIESLSDDGYLWIAERRRSVRRELEIEPGRAGEVEYGYYENGRAEEFDEDAKEWFADILIEIIHRTGVGAEERVERILRTHGFDGVVDEIRGIESDYVKRIYLSALVETGNLNRDQWSQTFELVARELDSDYEKAELLIDAAPHIQADSTLIRDYVDVVETIDSDYETRKVLAELGLQKDASPAVLRSVFDIVSRLDSDYEKAELLIDMADFAEENADLRKTYIRAVQDIDSDYEARRVLSAISMDREDDPEVLRMAFDIASRMDSDYEKAELLIDLSDRTSKDVLLAGSYWDALEGIDSDYETRRVVSAFVDKRPLDSEMADKLLVWDGRRGGIVHSIDSDYEKAELLIDLAEACEGNEELQKKLMGAAVTLDSDYEKRRVLESIYGDCHDSPDATLETLTLAEIMDSDYDRAEILIGMVDCLESDPDHVDEFLQVTRLIDSDYETRRVLSSLVAIRELTDNHIFDILETIDRMSSDYEKTQVLLKMIRRCRGNDVLEDSMMDVIESLDSDYERDKLLSRLYRDSRDRKSGDR